MAHSGVIIALYPNPRHLQRLEAVARRLPDGTPADEMHVTICYLGEVDALESVKIQIMAQLMILAEQPPVPVPLTLRVRGLQRMEHDDDGKNAIAARIVCPDLHSLRSAIVDALKVIGVEPDQTFPVYQPHLTLGYVKTYLPTPDLRVPMMSVDVGWLYLCWGDEKIVIPMAGGVEVKAVSGPMAAMGSGPGGLFSNPALGSGPVRRREKIAATVTTKPFASQAQQRWAFGTGQPFAKRWADATDFSNLPRKVRRKSTSARRRHLAALALKASTDEGSGTSTGGSRGYSARAGEVISGRLVRGSDGKFTSGDAGPTEAKPANRFGMPKDPRRDPKKPKGAKGGGKGAKPKAPKKTAEERAAEREAKRAAEQAANLAAVGDALMGADAPISANGLDALAKFAAGESLDAETAKQLADLGVVTLGADGTPRLSPDGRKLVNAAKRGDTRGALDAAFAAGEKMGIGAAGERLPDKTEQGEGGEASAPSGSIAGGLRPGRGGDPLEGIAGALEPGKEKPKGGGGGGGGGKDDKPGPAKTAAARAALNRAGPSGAGAGSGGGGKPITGTSAEAQQAVRGAEGRAAEQARAAQQAGRSRERQAQLEARRQAKEREGAERTAAAVERSGMAPRSCLTLRRLAEGGGLSANDAESAVELASLGLMNDRLEVNSQGRRALSALERGDMRDYVAAVQDARDKQDREFARLERELARGKTLGAFLVSLKHGKHDQSSHGRKGARGNAARSAYTSARAGGASHKQALAAANDVSRAVQVKQRLANIDKQLGGQVSARQRASLEAEQRRLAGEQDRLTSRMTPEARAAAEGATVAPTVRGRTAPAKPQPAKTDGDTTRAYGADPNTSYTMQHRLVDMADVKASNLPNGAINPDYNPALQPRDRSRAASQAQIDQVARNLNSDVLVTDFHRIDAGSPIIDADGNVLSGNGRTLALQRARELNPEQYAAYKARLKDEAARLGIDPAAVDQMRNPVLVRELKGDADPVAFAREANSSGTLRMSPLEQAMVDAGQIPDRSLLKLAVKDGQGIDQALRDPGNKAFINDFLATVPANERANLLTRNGDLNQMGLYRAKAALYTKAFPGEAGSRLAESMLESLDPDVKSIQNGISSGLPNISRATALIRSGDRDRDLDLTEDFARTIDVYARIKDNPALTANTPANQLVSKYLSQSQMFDRELTPDQEKLLRHVDSISRKPTAVAAMFNRWASIVEDQPPPGQVSLFGGGRMSKGELIDALIGNGSSGPAQAGLFDG